MSPVVVGEPAPRPSWDEWALGVAAAVAARADCTRRKVGAVLLGPDRRIVGAGYNGYPAGLPGCLSAGACPRGRLGYDQVQASSSYTDGPGVCGAIHAEENAVMYTDRAARVGAVLYVTDEPCPNCQRFLAGSGISAVVWPDGRRDLA
jgi:dCMP deaminase